MTAHDHGLPARMHDYDVHAELREAPDLHRLAQVFIGMALARAERVNTKTDGSETDEIESET